MAGNSIGAFIFRLVSTEDGSRNDGTTLGLFVSLLHCFLVNFQFQFHVFQSVRERLVLAACHTAT